MPSKLQSEEDVRKSESSVRTERLRLMNGIEALVHFSAWFEDVLGTEKCFSGRGGLDPKCSWTLHLCGRKLFYSIVLDGGFVFVSVQPMDSGEPLETLLVVGDCSEHWRQVCRLIQALERSGIESLKSRPIELGTPGSPDSWVIS
ncbi:MAG: hypothetical protein WCC08_22525 [Terrimicrobiaceae bacterium]